MMQHKTRNTFSGWKAFTVHVFRGAGKRVLFTGFSLKTVNKTRFKANIKAFSGPPLIEPPRGSGGSGGSIKWGISWGTVGERWAGTLLWHYEVIGDFFRQ